LERFLAAHESREGVRTFRKAQRERINALATVAGAFAAASVRRLLRKRRRGHGRAVNSVADTPFLIADRKGFFKDVGVDVKFQTFIPVPE